MLSAVVLVKNEEKHIINCLDHLSFADEIIVVDDHSTDRTSELLESYSEHANVKVVKHELAGNFAKQRNFGLEKANGDWVLFIDADERVSKALAKEIQQEVKQPQADAYFVHRYDVLWGKKLEHGEIGNVKLLRLARKEAGVWHGKVHEVWEIKGTTKVLDTPLLHYPHENIDEFLQKINFYTDLRAEELYEQKVKVAWWQIIAYPKAKFLMNYMVRQGYKDGMPGLIVAILMSFHSFLVRGKLWQKYNS